MQSSQANTRMLVSFGIAVAFWWWMLGTVEMALGFLALLFVHEMGHYLAAKQKNIAVTPPVFTPLGAFIGMQEMPKNARDEAYMAIAGPVAGSVAAYICLALGVWLDVPMMQQLAIWGLFLNLFNLIPLSPLDGGRISMAIDRRLYILGIPMFFGVFYLIGMGMLGMIIFFLIMMQGMADIQMRKQMAQTNPEYFQVGAATRIGYIVAWLGLGSLLAYTILNPGAVVQFLVSLGL